MFCNVLSADVEGISAGLVSVEADMTGGLPAFNMVGSLSQEVKEAKERVTRALANSGIDIPPRRITINISPADIRKRGTGYDLAIAVAILTCMEIIKPEKIKNRLFVGELSLDGTINRVNGILPVTILAQEENIREVIVPKDNAFEGEAIEDVNVCGVSKISELIEMLNNDTLVFEDHVDLQGLLDKAYTEQEIDFKDVLGQEKAKRAALIAVCGLHNILFIGPPGSGKSMMAKRMAGITNRMTPDECLEISKIYSVLGKLERGSLVLNRPFRAPHHSITAQALVGGDGYPRPGEITLAHKGILFLDEACEFKKEVIEMLRQPLEDKQIVISRTRRQAVFPADFMLVLAANPCRCGYYPDRNICRCKENDIEKYFGRIKGPILDRIDICVGTNRIDVNELSEESKTMSTDEMTELVLKTQEIQRARYVDDDILFNSQMSREHVDRFCILDDKCKDIIEKAYKKMHMSARGYYKTLKVARTIADIDNKQEISESHLLEALSYRHLSLER